MVQTMRQGLQRIPAIARKACRRMSGKPTRAPKKKTEIWFCQGLLTTTVVSFTPSVMVL